MHNEDTLTRLLEAYEIPEKRGWQATLAERLGVKSNVVSGWKKRGVPERIVSNAAIETGVSVHWLLTGEGEKFVAQAQTSSSDAFDRELLSEIVIFIEEIQEELKVRLKPAKKAELILMLYDMFDEEEEVDREKIVRLVKLAA